MHGVLFGEVRGGRVMRILYQVGEELLTSRELLRKYHPDGEAVVAYADGGWRGKEEVAPGFVRELAETMLRTGAVRITLDSKGKKRLLPE